MNQHQTITFGVRYRLERRLGQGGMGTVYQAHDRLNGQRIALKLVPGKNDHDLSALHLLEGSSTQVALGTNPQTAPELLATQIPTPSTQISTVGIRPTTRSALWARVALAHEFRTLAALRHPHIFPTIRPRCLLWHSRYAQNLGAVRVSKELAKAAITTARQLALPFDERLALAWLDRCDQIPHGFTQGLSAELREFSRIMADLIRNRWEASQDHAESKASSLK